VRVEGVDFARPSSRFTRDFEQLVAWLATKMDKDALRRLVGIDWDTVGRICDRVVADELDPDRLDDLYDIGVDEISWKKHHNYLTLVVNHTTNKVVWGAEGRDAKTLDGFFDELGEVRSGQIRAVSMDMGPAFRKSVLAHAEQATICFDPFHVVKVGTDALNTVRRDIWQQLRQLPDPDIARKFKGARWALLKNPEDLTARQAATLTVIRRHGGTLWRAYQRKEELRAIFAGGLTDDETAELLDRWCARVQRSRLQPFIKAGRTIRKHRDGILAAIRLGLTNASLEGLNQRVRLIMRRAFGFHSAKAALALVMLSAGPVNLTLPWENRPPHDPHPCRKRAPVQVLLTKGGSTVRARGRRSRTLVSPNSADPRAQGVRPVREGHAARWASWIARTYTPGMDRCSSSSNDAVVTAWCSSL
jgi:transposase